MRTTARIPKIDWTKKPEWELRLVAEQVLETAKAHPNDIRLGLAAALMHRWNIMAELRRRNLPKLA